MKFAIAQQPKTKPSQQTAVVLYTLVAMLAVTAALQLISFETFILTIREYQLPGGEPTSKLTAGIIVTAEVLALPFILRMRLSFLMRWISLVSLQLMGIFWLILGLWLGDGWLVLYGLTLGLLGGYATWQLRRDVMK